MKKIDFKLIGIITIIIVSVLIMSVFGLNGVKNEAIFYEEAIKTAQSDINVQEKRRADLLPNLVDCVKAYDKHEYETLLAVIETRGTNADQTAEEIQTMIKAVAEAYPELKSSDNYKQLMNELATTENLISNYRSSYNKQVRSYNKYIKQFPNKQILSILGYEAETFTYLDYEVSEDAPTNLFGD